MVLKHQLQDLLRKQFFNQSSYPFQKNPQLFLAIASVHKKRLILSDGIYIVSSSKEKKLKDKFVKGKEDIVEWEDLPGFVCLFKNCRFVLADRKSYKETDLNFKKFILNKKHNFVKFEKKEEFTNLGSNLTIKEETYKNVECINIESDSDGLQNSFNNKFKSNFFIKNKQICHNKNNINVLLEFDSFEIVCPFGFSYLNLKNQTFLVDSLFDSQKQILIRNFFLEKHISKITKRKNTNDGFCNIGEILEDTNLNFYEVEETTTCTSTSTNKEKNKTSKLSVLSKRIKKNRNQNEELR